MIAPDRAAAGKALIRGRSWWCRQAWLPEGLASDVRLIAGADGRFTDVQTGVGASGQDTQLPGIVLPGFADAHSHAFHRALRGRTHSDGGTFWTWRDLMYSVAAQLDPDSYRALATAVYAESALAGVTCIGEFHYLHHGPGGTPYDDPNAMGEALREAAAAAGIRLTLLDAAYLNGGLDANGHQPLNSVQERFADADIDTWAQRSDALQPDPNVRIGVAVHSVRAVPAEHLARIGEVAAGRPLHVHLSEQPAENETCQAVYGCSPTELLDRHGLLGPATTAVHATHLTDNDIAILGARRVSVCLCPSTEADLADGLPPTGPLLAAGVRLCAGSDQHVAADLLAEARGVELHERLRTGRRGTVSPAALLNALTTAGHAALGWPEAGRLEVGAPADLVAIEDSSPRTAGTEPSQIIMTAGTADIRTVVVGGATVVTDGRHVLGDIGKLIDEALALLDEPIGAAPGSVRSGQ
ncbi:MAG: formimidoylglutamate deiminase [Actinomycetota bacterium]|nr:formimidoylglutamate deiminase [Actinomycetota bacterium]